MSSTPYTDCLVETIESCREASAIGTTRKLYCDALEYIDDGRYSEALTCLNRAEQLELEAGNSLPAKAAIQALLLADSE